MSKSASLDLRTGAREHAEYQALREADQSMTDFRHSISGPDAPRPGHAGEAPFPAGKYPASYAEVCGRIDALAQVVNDQDRQIESLEAEQRRLSGLVEALMTAEPRECYRGMAPKPGDAVWAQVAGETAE